MIRPLHSLERPFLEGQSGKAGYLYAKDRGDAGPE
jgi:hypothetical protein